MSNTIDKRSPSTLDPEQLGAQIRFALEQLSERNAQHDWEHLGRHLAREHICPNILPATGPVQAGGDQGRDFETFRTYLARECKASRTYLGLILDRPIVFACTLEKRIDGKIREDVATIMAGGQPVEAIYFFCSRDLAVAKRHLLQEWARTTHQVHLEILDRQAVAELLSGRDSFWIAVRYLHLPGDLLPAPTVGDDDWYTRALGRWRQIDRSARTVADFVEIRAAARTALGPFVYGEDGRPQNGYERPELPFWIEQLDDLASEDAVPAVRRRAVYEASVLRLRGIGTLAGQEARLRTYFAEISQLDDAVDLGDAEVLLTYVSTASTQGIVGLEARELRGWFRELEQRINEQIERAKRLGRVNERCVLLEIRGHLALFRDLVQYNGSQTGALAYWNELVELVAQAPLFPLERLADRLAEYARYIGAHEGYQPLTEAVDALLAQRVGQFKVAETCLKRARALREAGDLPQAMAQLHRAKIDWFAEETLEKALLALRWLSQAYEEQGLLFAAKYHALAAAYIALHAQDLSLKTAIALSLEHAAVCDYAVGAWHGFLDLAEAVAACYPQFVRDSEADAGDPDSTINRLLFHLALIPVATQRLHPELSEFAAKRCAHIASRLGLADVLEEVASNAETSWARLGQDRLREAIEEQLAGPPWSDAGSVCHAQWRAHGVRWSVQWSNTYEMMLAAHEFLSAFQIILSDLANYDLCLMRSTVRLSLHLATDNIGSLALHTSVQEWFDVDFAPSNDERLAVVTLPPYRYFRDGRLSYQDLQEGAIGVASALLADVSLLPTERFTYVIDDRFGQGLPSKIHVGAPLGQCLRTFVTREEFDASSRMAHTLSTFSESFSWCQPEQLSWVGSVGPGYSLEEAHEQIKNRYERFTRPIAHTLRWLAKEPSFQLTVERLRTDGWKDWHVLAAVFHSTVNYRMAHRQIILLNDEAERAANYRLINEPEREDALRVPIVEYTEEKLRQYLRVFMVNFAMTYGLEIHQYTPDMGALEDFLAHRYNFWTDDVAHEDVFSMSGGE